MRRREFTAFLGTAAAWPFAARAQQPKIHRIGYLAPAGSAGLSTRDEAFRQGLHALGYVEGKNILIEYRFAQGVFERLPTLAAELVALPVEVIVAVVTQAALAAKAATNTIPIVMAAVSDPLASGLVASLARPGANITGTSSMNADVVGKALEVLKEAIRAVTHVAVLWNPANAIFQGQMLRNAQSAAARLGLQLQAFGVRGPADFDGAFAAIAAARAGALLILPDPVLISHNGPIIGFAERTRLPAMYGTREDAAAGGLMAYGPNVADQYRRAAAYVDRILKGARPGDLPIEQPTKFELAINLRTARALGLAIPNALLLRADELIE